jgi:hypothetical protein
MGTVEILTPCDEGECTELASGVFRKHILPKRAIQYTDKTGKRRTIDFNDAYLADLARSFRANAFDEVALQMADGANTHTLDPERKRAEVISLEVADDGMYALVKPNNEQAAQYLRENPKMGVSARIIEGMKRSDGQQFSRALHHVLVTTDPQIPGLNPWQEVEAVALASGDPDETVNLAGASYEGTTKMGQKDDGQVTLTLDATQAARLQELLAVDPAVLLARPQADVDPDDVDPDVTAEAIEMVRAEVALANENNALLTQRLNDAEISKEIGELVRTGLAPAIIEAARPLLSMQSGAVELSNVAGETVDPGATMRLVLDTVVQLNRAGLDVVDLNREVGSLVGQEVAQQDAEREAALDLWSEQYGN